MLEKH